MSYRDHPKQTFRAPGEEYSSGSVCCAGRPVNLEATTIVPRHPRAGDERIVRRAVLTRAYDGARVVTFGGHSTIVFGVCRVGAVRSRVGSLHDSHKSRPGFFTPRDCGHLTGGTRASPRAPSICHRSNSGVVSQPPRHVLVCTNSWAVRVGDRP